MRVFVRVGSVVKASKPVTGRRFLFSIDLPPRDVTVRVVAEDAAGYRASARVGPVYGLPRAGRPTAVGRSVEDGPLARRVERLAQAYGGVAAVFVQDLQSGRGAAWNARARFPAASTVKLAIAIETLRRLSYRPAPGSDLYRLLWSMLVYSDNAAANALLTWIGGSTSGGAAQVNTAMQRLGIVDTLMYGGYADDDRGRTADPAPRRGAAGVRRRQAHNGLGPRPPTPVGAFGDGGARTAGRSPRELRAP